MFIGHYALGLASKGGNKAPSLAVMFIAVQLLDLLWPLFVLLGIETVQIEPGNTKLTPLAFTFYPYSHSLLMSVVWGLLFGWIYFFITKNRQGSVWVFGLVVSHWILDLITHIPDLPLSPFGNLKLGLGLWNYPVVESIIEIGFFVVGTMLYFKFAKPQRKIAFWILIVFFLLIHLMNILGPPPPTVNAVAWSGNLMWLFVLWAWWIEKKEK
ncbi:MAG: hypothetical protein LBE82_03030 [Chitinophagaceae bacterium]|jgi:membrane-bound metal-dependent hydrolase YbcI (DUF457 family)|nr:hypothetical protein [Chitinophagaceae bacterium]